MGSFKLGGMTLGSLFKKPETLRYPFEKKEPYAGQKGHITNDVTKCILCSKCQKTCPTGAIVVDKANSNWAINPFLCIQCASCVRACPVDSLAMDGMYTPVSGEIYSKDFAVEGKKKKAAATE
jgi:formate hydrogenlyase subunit 6/NADH:ubiquinone oxidoreductase subunit I